MIIAGPCAAESSDQIERALGEAKSRQLDFVRISLWKPRTRPGFEGVGQEGLPWLVQAVQAGLNPATEVLTPSQAEAVLEAVLPALGDRRLLLWIGARNQNHLIQRDISRLVSQDQRVKLLIKNQPWLSREHWLGMLEHVLAGGISHENLILCHRGFTPGDQPNPQNYRNLPDFELAMVIKLETGLPIVFDPSHSGGSVKNALILAKQAFTYDFDGLMVEVHPNPPEAKSDASQQLTWQQFDELLSSLPVAS